VRCGEEGGGGGERGNSEGERERIKVRRKMFVIVFNCYKIEITCHINTLLLVIDDKDQNV